MQNFVAAILALLLAVQNSYASTSLSPDKKKLIDTLLEQTGQSGIAVGKQFSDVFIQQMTVTLKKSKPDIDPRAFEILQEEITSLIDEEIAENGILNKMMYPIYDKHFTEDELKEMIEHNNTELGKKLIRLAPTITQEAMLAGQQFGQALGPKIQQRLVERFEEEGIK